MRGFLNGNRHQTVTQTGHPNGVPRKLRIFNKIGMRRAGIEPATYEFKEGSDLQLKRFSPRRIISEFARIARKARESVLGNRNANVIANSHSGQFRRPVSRPLRGYNFSRETRMDLERAAREELRQFTFRRGS